MANRMQKITTSKPSIFSVLSGKGGVGKSVILSNLAAISALNGFSSLIVDTDLYFGNQHILTNANARYTLNDLAEGKCTIDSVLVDIAPNLQLIASPSIYGINEDINFSAYHKLLGTFKSDLNYDYVFIDTPSSSVKMITEVARISDFNLIVLNPELTSINDSFGLFKHLLSKNGKKPAWLLVNRTDNPATAEFIYQKFACLAQKFLNNVPLSAGWLLDSKHIYDAIARQKPVCELFADSDAVESLDSLFRHLTGFYRSSDRESENNSIEKNNLMAQQPI